MAAMPRKYAALCLIAAFTTGCSALKVYKSPDASDTGVRFYRPKPYLLVTPAEPTGRMVNIKLDYLPDFNEEYSAHLRRGTALALQDGWNLVGVNTGDTPKKEAQATAPIANIAMPNMVVAATNVPMGYYESVYDMSGPNKVLKGCATSASTSWAARIRPDPVADPAATRPERAARSRSTASSSSTA